MAKTSDHLEDEFTGIEAGHENAATSTLDSMKATTTKDAQRAIERKEGAEMPEAAFFLQYLRENVQSAQTLEQMRPIIENFREYAPPIVVSKCIDGRVHGSKGKGYPPTSIVFARTEGANVDLSWSNVSFWSRLNRAISESETNGRGMPALFIALGHRAEQGHGCAAHGLDDVKALSAVQAQTTQVRNVYRKAGRPLYVIAGMTNTDDMSERLHFEDETQIDTARIIEELKLEKPEDVFSSSFLDLPLDDPAAGTHTGNKVPRALLEGDNAPMYQDLETALAMEAYLIREVSKLQRRKGEHADVIFNPAVYRAFADRLNAVSDLPESLKAPLMYQCLWNTAYVLYQRKRLTNMAPDERMKHLEHDEGLICYGEGFELLPRNRAILAKTGRGNDMEALRVAMKVLQNNRKANPQAHPPLIHINVEIFGALDSWDAYGTNVLARIMTMQQTISAVAEEFEVEPQILTTYSYAREKRFYPIDANGNNPLKGRQIGIDKNLNTRTFTEHALAAQEYTYTQRMFTAE